MQRSYSNAVGNVFYQKIGSLFFAIAMTDGTVHSKEIDKLKSIVRTHWLPIDALVDEYGTDSAYQIETVFDWLLANEKSCAQCFDEFRDFFKEYPELFSAKVKWLIFKTSNAVASAFAGKNKSELIILGKLQLLFDSAT